MDLDAIPPLTQPELDAVRRRAIFLCSHPKCGRTWVRFMLGACLNRALDLGVELDLKTIFRIVPNDAKDAERFRAMGNMRKAHAFAFAHDPRVPAVLATHARCRPALLKRPAVLLARSIPDTLASHHAQRVEGGREVPTDLASYLRMDPSPVDALIDFYNGWADGVTRARAGVLVTSYERFRADPRGALGELCSFVGLDTTDPTTARALDGAVTDASIDSMRRLERERGAWWNDRAERAKTRVRRGRVGGAREDLSPADLADLHARCEQRLSQGAARLLKDAGAG